MDPLPLSHSHSHWDPVLRKNHTMVPNVLWGWSRCTPPSPPYSPTRSLGPCVLRHFMIMIVWRSQPQKRWTCLIAKLAFSLRKRSYHQYSLYWKLLYLAVPNLSVISETWRVTRTLVVLSRYDKIMVTKGGAECQGVTKFWVSTVQSGATAVPLGLCLSRAVGLREQMFQDYLPHVQPVQDRMEEEPWMKNLTGRPQPTPGNWIISIWMF